MTLTLTGATRISDWGVIRAEGEEAAKFLHGQLTQDFALLGLDEARFAGFCTAKGRLMATMIGWKADANTVLLALPLELLPAIQKRLTMFVMRAKCKLSDATGQVALWGAIGSLDDKPQWSLEHNGDVTRIRLPDNGSQARWLIAQSPDAPAPAALLSEGEWQWSELEAGQPSVLAATSEQFVPQMLNLELLDGVNFQKGCYPGQEVVARSQYRGTLKRRTYLYELEGVAKPGQEIFHSEDPGQPAGLVANVAQVGASSLVLAETKIAALGSGSLHLGAPDGPLLTNRPLPYSLTQTE